MTIPTFNAVGFCAHYSKQGDWAFDFALQISQLHNVQLNVFHFLKDPYNPNDVPPKHLSHEELENLAIAEEKKLRLYYDERAGEYLNVGFRLCYDDSWSELHRCLMIREFQLLILGYTEYGVRFSGKPIEKFNQLASIPQWILYFQAPGENEQSDRVTRCLQYRDVRK